MLWLEMVADLLITGVIIGRIIVWGQIGAGGIVDNEIIYPVQAPSSAAFRGSALEEWQ